MCFLQTVFDTCTCAFLVGVFRYGTWFSYWHPEGDVGISEEDGVFLSAWRSGFSDLGSGISASKFSAVSGSVLQRSRKRWDLLQSVFSQDMAATAIEGVAGRDSSSFQINEGRQLAAWDDRILWRPCAFRTADVCAAPSPTNLSPQYLELRPNDRALTSSTACPSMASAEAEPATSSEDASLKAAICCGGCD